MNVPGNERRGGGGSGLSAEGGGQGGPRGCPTAPGGRSRWPHPGLGAQELHLRPKVGGVGGGNPDSEKGPQNAGAQERRRGNSQGPQTQRRLLCFQSPERPPSALPYPLTQHPHTILAHRTHAGSHVSHYPADTTCGQCGVAGRRFALGPSADGTVQDGTGQGAHFSSRGRHCIALPSIFPLQVSGVCAWALSSSLCDPKLITHPLGPQFPPLGEERTLFPALSPLVAGVGRPAPQSLPEVGRLLTLQDYFHVFPGNDGDQGPRHLTLVTAAALEGRKPGQALQRERASPPAPHPPLTGAWERESREAWARG